MNTCKSSPKSARALRPLTLCVATLLGTNVVPEIANAAITVSNCNDNGVGSLRQAIANASNADVIDMTTLTCSTISLNPSSGALAISQPSLTLNGPGMDKLNITGLYNGVHGRDRIVNQQNTGGTLAINDLTISYGYLTSSTASVSGGCIYSKGSVYLKDVAIESCVARTSATNFHAQGGGFSTGFSPATVTMVHSLISGNRAESTNTSNYVGATGGGIYSDATATYINYSTIDGNTVSGAGMSATLGGGVSLGTFSGTIVIANSTISHNSASDYSYGAGLKINADSGGTATIRNSTISGNSATKCEAGADIYGVAAILNSTIAFNSAGSCCSQKAPGLSFTTGNDLYTLNLQSTLIANNTCATTAYDFSAEPVPGGGSSVSGSDNLILASSSDLPSNTVTGVCPLLGPLRDNGGVTQTHALLSHSAGIDQGNTKSTVPLPYDQRGSPYTRVSGIAADIGSYEVQQDDIVFNASFDGCPFD
jgi:hypothetical protein